MKFVGSEQGVRKSGPGGEIGLAGTGEVIECGFDLLRVGRSSVDGLVNCANSPFARFDFLDVGTSDESVSTALNEAGIQGKQGLLRDGRVGAFHCASARVSSVKGADHFRYDVAI